MRRPALPSDTAAMSVAWRGWAGVAWAVASVAGALAGAGCGHGAAPQPGAAGDTRERTAAELAGIDAAEPAVTAAIGVAAEPATAAEPVPEPPPPEPAEHGVSGLAQALPPVSRRPSGQVEQQWRAIKKTRDLVAQAERLDQTRLDAVGCEGLVDFRALTEGRASGFAYRDDVRGRSWVHPALARALVTANAALRAELPTAVVTVGDIAQPGCGQLSHGALVREHRGAEAVALMNRARLMYGVPTVRQWRTAADWPSELVRFAGPNEPILEESVLVAQASEGAPGEDGWAVRAVTRRYRRLADADATTEQDLDEVSRRLMKEGVLVREREVLHWDPELGDQRLWLQHWVSPDEGRQMLALSRARQRQRLKLETLVEVRLSRWQAGKPDSFPNELRWVAERQRMPEAAEAPAEVEAQMGAGVRWQRWEMVYEAGHQTHLAGRDADLSFVTTGNADHFAVNLDAIDAAATWRWFELLDEAAREAGAPIERILVDVSVKRVLKARLPKKVQRSKLWRNKLRLASGHDAHHHVRVSAADAKTPDEIAGHLAVIDEVLGARAAEGPRVAAPPQP